MIMHLILHFPFFIFFIFYFLKIKNRLKARKIERSVKNKDLTSIGKFEKYKEFYFFTFIFLIIKNGM